MRVLIVEDDITSRRLLEITLIRWGYEVVCAENGKDAITIMEEVNAPKLIILDWMMPEMDGVEVCKHYRKFNNTDFKYIIILTSKNTKCDVTNALAAGANDFISKPYENIELQTKVKEGFQFIASQANLAKKLAKLMQNIPKQTNN